MQESVFCRNHVIPVIGTKPRYIACLKYVASDRDLPKGAFGVTEWYNRELSIGAMGRIDTATKARTRRRHPA